MGVHCSDQPRIVGILTLDFVLLDEPLPFAENLCIVMEQLEEWRLKPQNFLGDPRDSEAQTVFSLRASRYDPEFVKDLCEDSGRVTAPAHRIAGRDSHGMHWMTWLCRSCEEVRVE